MLKQLLSETAWFLGLLGTISAPVFGGLLGLWAFTSLPTASVFLFTLFLALAWSQARNWKHGGESDDKLGWTRMSEALDRYVEQYCKKREVNETEK